MTHPSDYALDRGGAEIDAHVAGCAACRERVAAASAAQGRFEADVLPRTLGRVRARLATPARPRWRVPLFAGAAVAAFAATLLFLRAPGAPPAVPYDGLKGDAGPPLAVFVKRGADVWALAPGQKLRAGDALRFVARVPRPRYLELRGRDAAGRERTLFPEGARAVLVQPGEALPGGFVVDAAPGPEIVVALVADHAFSLGQASEADVEVVRVELPKEP